MATIRKVYWLWQKRAVVGPREHPWYSSHLMREADAGDLGGNAHNGPLVRCSSRALQRTAANKYGRSCIRLTGSGCYRGVGWSRDILRVGASGNSVGAAVAAHGRRSQQLCE
jgi:hypothetical protein